MVQSKGIRLGSQSDPIPPPLFYAPKPSSASWRSGVIQSIKKWLAMCCGSRTSHKTSDAAVRRPEEGRSKLEEDCEPLMKGGGMPDMEMEMEKREVPRMTFPRHAAASFLKTGTSRAMREANYVL
ncbi:hypothetical protein Trco_002725 [Trichoderma cornu-damae]|uniref:Uncharacterized protein n=1 Tax=Trichoderma cornu-damae TaxID=654480 RepID=A0A9P8TY36_9HYPO|nr:hypothetical protein Trco_002725 [Trichoderma cornu-damae]